MPAHKTKATNEGIVTAEVSEKRRPGQPTLYREEYCDQVIEWGNQGKSRTWMAAHLGIDRRTIDNWALAHPEFFIALSRAKALEQAHWEDLGYGGLTADKFNGGVWTKSMAARFPDEWRDSQNVATVHSGSVSHSIEYAIIDANEQDKG